MDFSTALNPANEVAPVVQPQQPGMAEVIAPDPLATIARPATSPAEIEQRKAGWAAVYEKMQLNPNLMNAMAVTGAGLMQPIRPGQTVAGQAAQSVMGGMQAFKAGEVEQYNRGREARKDSEASAESGARVAASGASTDLARAQLPGVQSTARTTVATEGDRIAQSKNAAEKVRLELEQADLNLKNLKSDQDVVAAERKLRTRKAEIASTITDERILAGINAEIDKSLEGLNLVRQQIKTSAAAAGASNATARAANLRTDEAGFTIRMLQDLEKNDPTKLQQLLTKTGPFSASQSGDQQRASLYGSLYDKLPDADKKGKTREQFQMHHLTAAKKQDKIKALSDYLRAGGDDTDLIAALTADAKADMPTAGAATNQATTSGGVTYTWNGTKYVPSTGGASAKTPNGILPPVTPNDSAASNPSPADTTKYTRTKGNRGNWVYTRGARGAGRTRAEWEELDAAGN